MPKGLLVVGPISLTFRLVILGAANFVAIAMSSSNSLSLGHLFIIPAAWFCWRLARSRLYPTVLENIPGPQPSSWLTGQLFLAVTCQFNAEIVRFIEIGRAHV